MLLSFEAQRLLAQETVAPEDYLGIREQRPYGGIDEFMLSS